MKLLVFVSVLLGFIKETQKIHIFSLTKVGKDTVRRDECKHCAWGWRGEIQHSIFIIHLFCFANGVLTLKLKTRLYCAL